MMPAPVRPPDTGTDVLIGGNRAQAAQAPSGERVPIAPEPEMRSAFQEILEALRRENYC
jgi:hypothetical protein